MTNLTLADDLFFISSQGASGLGGAKASTGAPLPALERLLPLARNGIPCFPGTDTGWVVIALALASE